MFKRMLVVVDEHSISKSAVYQAVEIARNNDAELLLFFVLPSVHTSIDNFVATVGMSEFELHRLTRSSASRSLLEASAIADAAGVRSQRAMAAGNNRAECVAEVASKRQCDLIVVEAESKNALLRLVGGSIVPGLITKARVPVLVCKEGVPKPKRRVKSYPRNHEQHESMPVIH
jgi:nucleotide-binding universal stress UspA family protein